MEDNLNKSSNHKRMERQFVNNDIRAPRVLCIDQNNDNLGIISISAALDKARNEGLDLVQVSPPGKDRVPTCKIIDYGKYKYEQSKKKKLRDKKQRESVVKIKEIRLRPAISDNDLEIKARKAAEFLKDGNKVKVTIIFKGREKTHKNIGIDKLNQYLDFINNSDVLHGCQASLYRSPAADGRTISAMIVRDSDGKPQIENKKKFNKIDKAS